MSKQYDEFLHRAYYCPFSCPLKSNAPADHPQFGAGNPNRPLLMLVTENPANDRRPRDLAAGGVNDKSPEQMVHDFSLGVQEYFQETRGAGKLDIPLWEKRLGLNFAKDMYFTYAFRCRKNGNTRDAETAQRLCVEHLKDEIRTVQPKVVLAFGQTAAGSVGRACGFSLPPGFRIKDGVFSKEALPLQRSNPAVYAFPHPASCWRHPSVSVDELNDCVVKALALCLGCTPTTSGRTSDVPERKAPSASLPSNEGHRVPSPCVASVAPKVRQWAEDRGQADKVIALLGWVQKVFPHLEGKLCGTQYYRLSFQGRVVAAFHLRKKGILMQFPLTIQDVTEIELEWRESEPSHRSGWSEALVPYSVDAQGILRTVLEKLI